MIRAVPKPCRHVDEEARTFVRALDCLLWGEVSPTCGPWFLIRGKDQRIESATQNPAVADATPREDIVAPEWPAPDCCGRKRPHAPHTWGGEGWSPFRCRGVA